MSSGPRSMVACVLHGPHDLRVERRAVPRVPDDRIKVRVAYGGICGSDLHYEASGRNGSYLVQQPLVLGHEVSGTVDTIGADVREGPPIGTPVVVHPADPCPPSGGATGRGLHRAPGGSYLGSASTWPHTQGAFAEFVDVRPDQLRVVPAGLPLRRAALAEPLAVALHGVGRLGDVTGRSVLVVGVGPIGALTVLALRHRGAAQVLACDLHQGALDVASALGADRAALVGAEQLVAERSVDAVVEASGSVQALGSAMTAVRDGGTIVQLGILPPGDHVLPLGDLQAREVAVVGSWRFDVELDEAVAVLEAHPEADVVISDQFEASNAVAAFRRAADPARSSKVLLQF